MIYDFEDLMIYDFEDLHVTGGDIPPPGDWACNGRCRTAPPELFFPGRGDSTKEAKDICGRCPVLGECRAYGLQYPLLQGIWGGLTGRERKTARAAPAPEATTELTATTEPVERDHLSARGALLAVLGQLVNHPGRWARVARYAGLHSAHSMASQLRNGSRPAPVVAGSWTFEGRRNDVGGSDLYARIDTHPTIKENHMYRQGDVAIIPTTNLPDGLRPVPREAGRVVLAHGEVTGHAHAIADPGCDLYDHQDLEDHFLQVLAEGGVELRHEEHATITLPPGGYIIRRQREYSPEAIRRVAD